MTGIDVDGPRPAVEWVTSLPKKWGVTPPERLLLMCLACDAYKWESAPSYDVMAEWTGMHRSSCAEIVARLLLPNDVRPALVEKFSVRGRRRTVWRLIDHREPSGDTGQLNRPAPPDGSDAEPSGPTGQMAAVQPSGPTGRLDAPEPSANRPVGPDSSDPNRRRTVGEPSANRPAAPDTPFALDPLSSANADDTDTTRSAEADTSQDQLWDDQDAPKPQKPPTLAQRAEALLRPWWDNIKADHPERIPAQSYVAVRGVIKTAMSNGKPDPLIIAGLNILTSQAKPISGGQLQAAMAEAARHPKAPPEFRPFAGDASRPTVPNSRARPSMDEVVIRNAERHRRMKAAKAASAASGTVTGEIA